MLGWGLFLLEAARSGISSSRTDLGGVPATVYQSAASDGPIVILAHGFAASRTMMEAFSLTLARAGYRIVALDFPGHGENAQLLSPNVSEIEGTTRQLVGTVQAVIDDAYSSLGDDRPIALIGHSMATDVIIRAAREDSRVGPLIAVAYYSDVVTDRFPHDLLIVTGEFERRLRAPALRALRQVEPDAREGDIVTDATLGVRRGAIVSPFVEHVGVLYSPTTLRASLDWLNGYYARPGGSPITASVGYGLVLALGGAFLLFRPLSRLLARPAAEAAAERRPGFW